MGHTHYLKLIVCPGCHHVMKVPFSFLGKIFHCSKCNKALRMVSKAEKNKVSVQSSIEHITHVKIKNLPLEEIILPEKRGKIVKFVERILMRMKNVLWLRSNKNS